MGSRLLLAVVFALGLCNAAMADEYFRTTRTDNTVPAHCAEPGLQQFSVHLKTLIVGVDGATKLGFTHSVPISRDDAAYFWMIFLGAKQSDLQTLAEVRKRKLEPEFNILLEAQKKMGFTFDKEGDVLEALAIDAIAREYPAPNYFITGGIEYSDGVQTAAIGELDLVIAERQTCRVIAVGETKLGFKQLAHAREQLKRFLGFLNQKCAGADRCR